MFSFLIGLAFVAMVVGPAILTAIQRARARTNDF
jgi:hypothetical protein